jgi:Protein of unknown function (DUF2752)
MNQSVSAAHFKANRLLDPLREYQRIHPVRAEQIRMLCVFALMLAFGLAGSTSTETIRLLGYPIPPLCTFKMLTGFDCPGCGLTRAFVFALHGQFYASYMMHIWGIPLALFVLIQIPYRLFLIVKDRPAGRWFSPSAKPWVTRFLGLSLVLPWLVKTAFLIPILLF